MQSLETKLNEMDAEIKGMKSERRSNYYSYRTRYTGNKEKGKDVTEEQKPEKPVEKVSLNDNRRQS